MVAPARVISDKGKSLAEPYLIIVSGWTEERYFREAPDNRYAEFEDGELIMPSPASAAHQRLVGFLHFLLRGFLEARGLGQVMLGPYVTRLRPGLDYEPDIFVVLKDQLDRLTERCLEGAPSLVIEVISESTRTRDFRTKAQNYREHGVPEYWIVDRDRHVIQRHILPPAASEPYIVSQWTESTLQSQAVAGFWIDVSWLWQEPLPPVLKCLYQILGTP